LAQVREVVIVLAMPIDPTNNPRLRSFVAVAAESPFPIQNLPYGVFRARSGGGARIGVAIGESLLDLTELAHAGALDQVPFDARSVLATGRLNDLMALGPAAWSSLRDTISRLLREDVADLQGAQRLRDAALLPQAKVEMALPVEIGDYTDFYSSREHATNVGIMFRGKDNALLPNWLHIPIGYHGRSSSIVLSGTPIRRPRGQLLSSGAAAPSFEPTRQLDFELETGFFIGAGNELGTPVPVDRAQERIFGLVLVNDWSARDVQRWEYQPLGPFLAKNFATSISPWVVPLQALEPFRVEGPRQDPEPLPYLRTRGPQNLDITLEVELKAARLDRPVPIATSNMRYLYWSMAQQLAHHTSGGCNLRPGDLLASGTISGPTAESCGSLLELSWNGTEPVRLGEGETRQFLEDGDELILRGHARGDGYRVGFGEVRGTILPATGEAR
jgi:fumarylacetoacetase